MARAHQVTLVEAVVGKNDEVSDERVAMTEVEEMIQVVKIKQKQQDEAMEVNKLTLEARSEQLRLQTEAYDTLRVEIAEARKESKNNRVSWAQVKTDEEEAPMSPRPGRFMSDSARAPRPTGRLQEKKAARLSSRKTNAFHSV